MCLVSFTVCVSGECIWLISLCVLVVNVFGLVSLSVLVVNVFCKRRH